jgi:Fic family protein
VLGGWGALKEPAPALKVQRSTRLRAVLDTVALSGSELSLEQATEWLEGKRGLFSAREVLELENAQHAYEHVTDWEPMTESDLLEAHGVLMDVLIVDAGRVRKKQLDALRALFRLVREERDMPAIVSAVVFHYELRRIRPFSDGNGRIGRLWQHALLRRASPLFAHVPTETLLREHQTQHLAAWRAARTSGNVDPFLEHMLEMLLLALQRLGPQLRSKPETREDRLTKARRALGKRWFSRKGYLACFPDLSTASASRDLGGALAARTLASRGQRRLMEYRFR